MKVYHGTSYENALKILKDGFNPPKQNWHVSNDEYAYFAYSLEDEQYAKEIAISNGQIAAALGKSKSNKIAVFSINIDENDIDEYKDSSCENMDSISLEIPLNTLNSKEINIEFIKNAFIPGLSLMYLMGCNKQYLNTTDLTEIEEKILYSNVKTFNDLMFAVLEY